MCGHGHNILINAWAQSAATQSLIPLLNTCRVYTAALTYYFRPSFYQSWPAFRAQEEFPCMLSRMHNNSHLAWVLLVLYFQTFALMIYLNSTLTSWLHCRVRFFLFFFLSSRKTKTNLSTSQFASCFTGQFAQPAVSMSSINIRFKFYTSAPTVCNRPGESRCKDGSEHSKSICFVLGYFWDPPLFVSSHDVTYHARKTEVEKLDNSLLLVWSSQVLPPHHPRKVFTSSPSNKSVGKPM